MMRTKPAGITTKLVILILLVSMVMALLSVRTRMQALQDEVDSLSEQVRNQTEVNAGLEEDIANSGDPDKIAAIAREKLDLVQPGERVFANANN